MKSLNDIFKQTDPDTAQDDEDKIIASASMEAYDAALDSLDEARSVIERQRDEMAERLDALKNKEVEHGEK